MARHGAAQRGAACSVATAMINRKVYHFLTRGAARRSVGPHLLIFFGAAQRGAAFGVAVALDIFIMRKMTHKIKKSSRLNNTIFHCLELSIWTDKQLYYKKCLIIMCCL